MKRKMLKEETGMTDGGTTEGRIQVQVMRHLISERGKDPLFSDTTETDI